MTHALRLVRITAAGIVLCSTALAAGKFSGGAGDGNDSSTAPAASLGGVTVSMAASADQVIARTRTAILMTALTITDGTTAVIAAATDIRITIPSSLPFIWDVTDTTADLTGSAAGKVSTSVSFENADRTVVIDVTSAFANNDTLIVSGLSFTNLVKACRAMRLELDIGNDTTVDAFADKLTSVTVARPGGPGYGASSYAMSVDVALVVFAGTVIQIY